MTGRGVGNLEGQELVYSSASPKLLDALLMSLCMTGAGQGGI